MHTKYLGSTEGVTIDSPAGVAHITDTYNTGYMVGDIKGAFLSSTETTPLVANDKITNGDNEAEVFSGAGPTRATVLQTSEQANGGTFSAKATFSGGLAPHYIAVTPIPAGESVYVSFDVYIPAAYTGSGIKVIDTADGSWAIPTVNTRDTWVNISGWRGAKAQLWAIGIGQNIPETLDGQSVYIDNLSIVVLGEDRSVNGKGLIVHGSITKAPVATGADLVAYGGFSATNYLEQPYNPDLDFGTGDFYVMGWISASASSATQNICSRIASNGAVSFYLQLLSDETLRFAVVTSYVTTPISIPVMSPVFVTGVRSGGVLYLYVDGELVVSTASTGNVTVAGSPTVCLGVSAYNKTGVFAGSLALWRIGAGAPSPDQIAKMYRDELAMIQGKAVLDGNDPAVKALAYDKERDLLHVASQSVVSSFRGLERVESTLDGVPELVVNGTFATDTSGWTPTGGTFVSVSGVGVFTGDSTLNFPGIVSDPMDFVVGKKYGVVISYSSMTPAGVTAAIRAPNGGAPNTTIKYVSAPGVVAFTFVAATTQHTLLLEIQNDSDGTFTVDNISIKEVSPAAPFTSLSAQDGALILSGEGGVDVQLPEVNIRERLAKTLHTQHPSKEDFEFTGDGTETTFTLNYGWKPKRVWVDGVKKRQGSAEDYTVAFDGFKYSVVFAVAPALNAEIDIEGVSV